VSAPLLRRLCLCALVALACLGIARAHVGGPAEYHVYPLKHATVGQVEQMLAERLAEFAETTHLVADRKTNRILLSAPDEAQRIARQLIESVDQPPETRAPSRPVVRAYPCDRSRLQEVADRLRRYFSNRDVRVGVDSHGGQLLVVTSPEIHATIPGKLAALRARERIGTGTLGERLVPSLSGTGPGASPISSQAPRARDADTASATSGAVRAAAASTAPPRWSEQFVPALHSRVDRIEPMLRHLIGPRLGRTNQSSTADLVAYRFVAGNGRRVELSVDRRRNGVMLSGDGSLVEAFVRLIRTLDGLQRKTGQAVRVVPVRKADPAKVQQAVQAYRSGYLDGIRQGRQRRESGLMRVPDDHGAAVPRGRSSRVQPAVFRQKRWRGSGLMANLFCAATEEVGQGKGQGNGEDKPDADAAAPRGLEEAQRRLRELGADVEVEALPDLDVIILRGRDRDVAEMARIIEEIERLSAETEPAIEIYPLRHVGGESLVLIVDTINAELLAGRQGRVSVTPLVKPNALLLIGWGDAVEAVKELIRKLDRPVAPETQLRVFRLKHMPAMAAQVTVDGFFSQRTGLGPNALVAVDARTNALIVQAAPRDMAEVALVIEELDRPTGGAVIRTRIFKLKNSLAVDLGSVLQAAIDAARMGSAEQKSAAMELLTMGESGEKLLTSGLLNDVRITPDVRTNALIVSAPAESINLLATLIEQLDSPTAVAQIKVFRITNGDAASLVEMLRSLLPSGEGTPGPQLPEAEGESSLVPVQFAVDTRTNSIIATGSKGDLKIIEALLLRLDEEDEQPRRNAVYRLKNAPAMDVATAINNFLSSERVVQQAAPGAINPFQRIESEVVVEPEPISNALIISATPRFFDEILELVEKLDEEPPQVMIQVLIAEIALGDIDEFGVELGLQDSLLFDRSLLGNLITTIETTQRSSSGDVLTSTNEVIQAADNTPGFAFNNEPLGNSGSELALSRSNVIAPQGLSSFGIGRVNSELGFGGLVLSASNESVSVLVRALQETRRLDVLSRPQVMTLDNQPAFIQIGKRVPRISGSTINVRGQVNNIQMENVGLILAVTPRISPEGKVVMEIDAEKSEMDSVSEGIPVSIAEGNVIRSPVVNLTTAQTTVSAADGETIVLGGLITKSTKTVDRRVPWLADLPLLGSIFRYDSDAEKRTELVIILTPHVVRNPEDAKRIKEIELARMHWCLGEVDEIHGDLWAGQMDEPSPQYGPPSTIYPDESPRGDAGERSTGNVTEPSSLQLSPPEPKASPETDVQPAAYHAVPALLGPLSSSNRSHARQSVEIGEIPRPGERGYRTLQTGGRIADMAPTWEFQSTRSIDSDRPGAAAPADFAQGVAPVDFSEPAGPGTSADAVTPLFPHTVPPSAAWEQPAPVRLPPVYTPIDMFLQ